MTASPVIPSGAERSEAQSRDLLLSARQQEQVPPLDLAALGSGLPSPKRSRFGFAQAGRDDGIWGPRPAHSIIDATVVHRRLRPRDNAFRYRVAYLCLGLEDLESAAGRWLRLDRRGLVSFRRADHGARDGSDLKAWLKRTLAEHGLGDVCDGDVVLMTLPRMLGYVFNPVSFWFCRDRSGALRAVLCEVNNTFGESHCYLVHHDDRRPIEPDAWLEGRKVFHVSPFLPVEGGYRFRFRLDEGRAHVDVNYHDAQGLMLATSVGGRREALTDASVLRRFLGNPTMTLAVVVRIHWQALHLLCKRARFHRKPAPPAELVTR